MLPEPLEDALRLHKSNISLLENQWPSPPSRHAPVAPTEEQLSQETWYHGRMSRRDAEKLLVQDGDFLVRDSANNPGQYVLTGMHCGQSKHLLLVDPEGVVSLWITAHILQGTCCSNLLHTYSITSLQSKSWYCNVQMDCSKQNNI